MVNMTFSKEITALLVVDPYGFRQQMHQIPHKVLILLGFLDFQLSLAMARDREHNVNKSD